MNKQTRLVYGVLVAVWALMIVWQVVEHDRVKRAAKAELRNRAKDISNTVGLVLGSQRHMITKERVESALSSLVKPEELNSVAMLNAAYEVVASAGTPMDAEIRAVTSTPSGEHWGEQTFALMNLVALGTNFSSEVGPDHPTIVAPRNELFPTNRPPFRPPGAQRDLPPPPRPEDDPATKGGSTGTESGTTAVSATGRNESELSRGDRGPGGERSGRPAFRRPFGMSPEKFDALLQRKGVHGFVVVMSTRAVKAASSHDLWLRLIISTLASISVVGLALAWSNLVKSGELEVRLVRAAELNTRLREMSLAAAGLAHETKNPLNIIRGLAQIISKRDDVAPEIREKTRGIIEEADRVTGQVNEFINFSRPRQLKPAPVALNSAVAEVVRALGPDLDEKVIRLEVQNSLPVIEADEQQLRQALFNLLINAIQAVERGGEIQVAAFKRSSTQAVLEIRDNGRGVSPEHRSDVFKPYFTTSQKGTGLGLAVVQQIVLSHGWEIECLANEPKGAVFRISHLRLATGA